jgi:hypothetical protein
VTENSGRWHPAASFLPLSVKISAEMLGNSLLILSGLDLESEHATAKIFTDIGKNFRAVA